MTPDNTCRTVDLERSECVDLTGMGDLVKRYLLEEHWHLILDEGTDEFVNLPARAIIVDAAGPSVELGPWSLSPDDARLLAASLSILADMAEATTEVTDSGATSDPKEK
ncbi:MAG: hypothetical protein ACR2P2_15455 [Nakamurella sp.]